MDYVVKIGDLYLTAGGTFSVLQREALRVHGDGAASDRLDVTGRAARLVRVRPRRPVAPVEGIDN